MYYQVAVPCARDADVVVNYEPLMPSSPPEMPVNAPFQVLTHSHKGSGHSITLMVTTETCIRLRKIGRQIVTSKANSDDRTWTLEAGKTLRIYDTILRGAQHRKGYQELQEHGILIVNPA